MTDCVRTLGVLGTLVWDTIHRHDESPSRSTEEWGGIGYALEALSAGLPSNWRTRPLHRVGEDLAFEAHSFLASIQGVDPRTGVEVVPDPHPRVELHYRSGRREGERLTGVMAPWSWRDLEPLVEGCDALYVNFITGFELELATATLLRQRFEGPIYADLHSLFLGLGRRGDRIPRPLPQGTQWLQAFDAVQMNEPEFHLLARGKGDPWALAARLVGPALPLITVTLEERGAAYVVRSGFDSDPFSWPGARGRATPPGPARTRRVPPVGPERRGDPTGCGDVWGSTTFARLLAGDDLDDAMTWANRMAARKLDHRGARGLARHLCGEAVEGNGA